MDRNSSPGAPPWYAGDTGNRFVACWAGGC